MPVQLHQDNGVGLLLHNALDLSNDDKIIPETIKDPQDYCDGCQVLTRSWLFWENLSRVQAVSTYDA